MPPGLLIALLRGLLLVGMLTAFGVSLGWSLANDPGIARHAPGDAGRDPGLRVLLTARREVDGAPRTETTHERLLINVVAPAYIVSPDQPDDPQFTLKVDPGEQLVVKPDADGLVFSSQTWGSEMRWQVSRLRLQPLNTTLPADGGPLVPARLDPRRFEERLGKPVFALQGRHYRGTLEVAYRSPKALSALNLLPIEAYVDGVTAVEMKASFPIEALKAQAIASRSYAYAMAWRAAVAKKAFDLSDSLDDQDYRGHGNGGEFVVQAVRETAGQILKTPRQRMPFVPYFCASNGGWSEAVDAIHPGATDVSGKEPIANLMVPFPDPFCQRAAEALGYLGSHWQQQVVLEPEKVQARLQEWLRARGDQATKVGYITGITIAERDESSQRVRKVAIAHTPNLRVEMSGHEFRMMMGPQVVRSTLWLKLDTQIRAGERRIKDYVLTTRGWGHGVGMSQISAWAMAKEGYRHQRILQTFYPGAEIEAW